MAYRKLNLDRDKINRCRDLAARIVKPIQKYIDRHSTLSIESATLCVFGVESAHDKKPLSDLIVSKIDRDRMRRGIAYWFGRALVHTQLPVRVLGHKIADGHVSFEKIPEVPFDRIREVISKITAEGFKRLGTTTEAARPHQPAILVSPDNPHELKTFTSDGETDIILLKDIGHLGNIKGPKKYGTIVAGLESPKQTIHALFAGSNFLLKDMFWDVLVGGINPKRALVDAHWTRSLCACAKANLISEGAHVHGLDAYRDAHEILVSQFIEERLGENGHIPPELFAVGHAFDIEPSLEDGFLHELARASLMREIYPRNPLIYFPPDNPSTLFYLASSITEQSIVVIGAAKDKIEAVKEAARILKYSGTVGDEIQFNPNGKIARRANTILENAFKTLQKIEHTGFLESLASGLIANKSVEEKGGSGLDGIFQKERDYFNPVEEMLKKKPEETYCLKAPEPIIKPEQEKKFQKGRGYGRHRHHRKSVFKKPPQGPGEGR